METQTLQQLLLEKKNIQSPELGDIEFADTEENELEIGLIGAMDSIRKHRNKRRSDFATREYYKKIQSTPVVPQRTYEQLYKHMEYLFPKFTIDVLNEQQFNIMVLYFSGDERLIDRGFSLNKGLCLMGGVGVGKTSLMKMFTHNQVQSYVMRSCLEIAKDYSIRGAEILDEFVEPLKTWGGSNIYNHEQLGVCFDDLGTEQDKKYFGNNSNVMSDIILNRYSKLNMSRNLTHFTTNLIPGEIEEKYGTRVLDRIKEMFNLIVFEKQSSRRK